ncbi:MAG TPA: hypothetical protein VMS17_18795 [Gemmataceae bacterium]|nr:hypothetical protein [Gemmataceae bacterium]
MPGPADAGTYSKNEDFATIMGVRGYHIVIDPGCTDTLAAIYAMPVQRVKPFLPGGGGP